jgi:hypothetical protein
MGGVIILGLGIVTDARYRMEKPATTKPIENPASSIAYQCLRRNRSMRLRGHHLICLHFFRGEGYSSDFVANLYELLDRAKSGEEIEVVDSADDVCRQCPHLKEEICCYREHFEAAIKEMDSAAFELLATAANRKIEWLMIGESLPAIFKDWSNRFCQDCDWNAACQQNRLWENLNL